MEDLKATLLAALILLAVAAGVIYGSEEIDPRVDAEFQYRYQN